MLFHSSPTPFTGRTATGGGYTFVSFIDRTTWHAHITRLDTATLEVVDTLDLGEVGNDAHVFHGVYIDSEGHVVSTIGARYVSAASGYHPPTLRRSATPYSLDFGSPVVLASAEADRGMTHRSSYFNSYQVAPNGTFISRHSGRFPDSDSYYTGLLYRKQSPTDFADIGSGSMTIMCDHPMTKWDGSEGIGTVYGLQTDSVVLPNGDWRVGFALSFFSAGAAIVHRWGIAYIYSDNLDKDEEPVFRDASGSVVSIPLNTDAARVSPLWVRTGFNGYTPNIRLEVDGTPIISASIHDLTSDLTALAGTGRSVFRFTGGAWAETEVVPVTPELFDSTPVLNRADDGTMYLYHPDTSGTGISRMNLDHPESSTLVFGAVDSLVWFDVDDGGGTAFLLQLDGATYTGTVAAPSLTATPTPNGIELSGPTPLGHVERRVIA